MVFIPSFVLCDNTSSPLIVPVNKVETVSFSPLSALVLPVTELTSVGPLLITADGFRVRDDLSPVILLIRGLGCLTVNGNSFEGVR